MVSARRAFSFAGLASFCALVACSGTGGTLDLTAPPPDEPDPPSCPTIQLVCNPGDEEVSSEAACSSGNHQTCYSRTTTCGTSSTTIWCGTPRAIACRAIPRCDEGDDEVGACPPELPGVTCYSRTTCGTTILCANSACQGLPTCDPGDKEVTQIDTCSQPGANCYARSKCSFTVWCERK